MKLLKAKSGIKIWGSSGGSVELIPKNPATTELLATTKVVFGHSNLWKGSRYEWEAPIKRPI